MDAVTVVARFRGAETGDDDFGEWTLSDNTIKHNEKHHEFNFDAVLNPSRSQADLYEAAGRKIISFFCDGYNATIFAYGQSGSGKTFSMLGPEEVTEILINSKDNIPPETAEMFGITPRATFHVFDNIREGQAKGTVYNLKVSYVEVYNEMINDILTSPPGLNLKMREFPNAGMCVIGLYESIANTPEAVFEALSNGTANRVVCSTGQNARSSRSHTVFIMALEQKTADGTVKTAKINLVDLAGSEKLSKTGAKGQSLTEAKNINLSLTTLGRCIKALTSGGAEFVPYRESKLTLILKESLSGAAMTTLIVTGSMRKIHQEETIGTMQFAERAKMVKTKAKSNTKRSYEELEKLFTKLSDEVKTLKAALGGGVVNIVPEISDSPQAPPVVVGENKEEQKAIEEMKEKYEALKEKSLKEIEELRARLTKAESTQNQIDYLGVHEEMEGLRDDIESGNKSLAELSAAKEQEMVKFENKIGKLNLKLDNFTSDLSHAKKELHANHKELKQLKSGLEEKDAEIFKLSQEAEGIQSKKKVYEDELEAIQLKIKEQGAKYPEMFKEIENLKHKIQVCIGKKQEIEEIIDKVESDSQEIIAKTLLLQKKETQFVQELESLSASKAQLEHAVAEVKHKKKLKKTEFAELKAKNEQHLSELHNEKKALNDTLESLREKISHEQKGPDLAEFNELKLKLAEEQSKPIISELNHLKQEKHEILKNTETLEKTLESLKESYQSNLEINSKLKEDQKKASISLAKLQKELADEKAIKSRISKNIKAFGESISKALKEAQQQAKTEEQIRITEYVQEINVMNNEIDKKERYIEEAKKNHLSEIKTLKSELLVLHSQKKASDEKLQKVKMDIIATYSELEQKKMTVVKNLNMKNDELQKLKEMISANEAKINLSTTEIEKLEADVRHKAAERDIERKKTMRQTIVPRKMSVFQAQIPNPEQKSPFHGVQLKKTDNKFLKNAIEESKNVQFHELYKVAYEFQAIKSLYANIDEPQVDDSMFVTVEESKESSSSDSD